MKVLAVYNTDHVLGGGEVSFTLTLSSLVAGGVDVLAVVPGPGPLTGYIEQQGIPVEIIPQETLKGSGIARLIWPSEKWTALVKGYRPDLIHCNAIRSALYAQAVGHALKVPVILHARKENPDPLDTFLLWRLSGIICISQVVRRRFPAQTGRAHLEVIYNAVDIGQMQNPLNAGALRNQWRRNEDSVLVGVPGRLSPIKGQHRLVHAAPGILSRFPQAVFVFIGGEDETFRGYVDGLKGSIREKRLTPYFVFSGFQADMTSVYQALDVVVFPTGAEAFGRIVIETGAARKPLVANDLEIIREILPEQSAEFVVNCDDSAAFAAKINALLESEDLRSQSAGRLHEHVRRTFGIENHRNRVLKMYDVILSSRSDR